jgi:SPP1 gp7 family putative phage head morphogenesis protein
MNIFSNIFGSKVEEKAMPISSDTIFVDAKEALQGQVSVSNSYKHDKEAGEEHPFDFSTTEGIYKKYGIVTGVIDKYVDFVMGPGFFFKVVGEQEGAMSEQAEQIVDDFIKDYDVENLLRRWLKEALIKGNAFIELGINKAKGIDGFNLLNANNMYVVRDEKGKVTGFNQAIIKNNRISKDNIISFSPEQIAHLTINKISDDAYGIGKIYPALQTIDNIMCHEKSLNMLIERKANVPYDVTIGNLEHKRFPTAADINAFGQKLEWLHNKHEWAHGPDVEIKALDFGNIGDKFEFVLKHNLDMLFFTFQVPEVLMGRGSIPEGLAKVQMEAFMMNVDAIQDEMEKIIEVQIIQRVLKANNIEVEMEMEWGKPNNDAVNARVTTLNSMVGKYGYAMDTLIEHEMVKLLGFDKEEYDMLKKEEEVKKEQNKADQFALAGVAPTKQEESDEEEEKPNAKEDDKPLPKVKAMARGIYAKFNCEKCLQEYLTEDVDYSLQEWAGFNFDSMLKHIIKSIALDPFTDLRAFSREEKLAGYLSKEEVLRLRQTFIEGFNDGKSVNWIKKQLIEKNIIPALSAEDADGNLVEQISAADRAYIVARTESIRLANKGNLDYLASNNIEKVRFISAISERTCEECSDLNGKIFELSEAQDMIPVHVQCRCTFAGVTELD